MKDWRDDTNFDLSDGDIIAMRRLIRELEKRIECSTFWIEGQPFTTCSLWALEVLKEGAAIPTERVKLFADAPDSMMHGWAKAELARRKEEGH